VFDGCPLPQLPQTVYKVRCQHGIHLVLISLLRCRFDWEFVCSSYCGADIVLWNGELLVTEQGMLMNVLLTDWFL
jgi:hypothetical protein